MIKLKNTSSGDITSFYFNDESISNYSYEKIKKEIRNNPTIRPCFRLFLLNPDETVKNEIPQDEIIVGGSYSENYQNGQRRSLSFSLVNTTKKYTPSINGLWVGTKFKYEAGLEIDNSRIWFPKGIFVATNLSPTYEQGVETISVETGDKFAVLEGKNGTLDTSYSLPVGSDIFEAVQDLLKLSKGNGDRFDNQPILFDSTFKGAKTQAKIEQESGSTIGAIISDIATQLNAEVFYNTLGQLTFVPINSVTDDVYKPLIFEYLEDEIQSLNLTFNIQEIVNKIIVIGSTSGGKYIRAEAVNDNPGSPLSYQRIGYRIGSIINDSNITSDYLAQDRADYELRRNLVLKSTGSINVRYNPLLLVNNIITISNNFYNLNQTRFLIQEISYPMDFSGEMSLSVSNIENFSFTMGGR